MATEGFDTYVFENGQFVPHQDTIKDKMQWSSFLEQQGYARTEQVWGQYPDVYLKVYEARSDAPADYKFTAVLNLVCFPHYVFVRDLNGLIQLLNLVLPLFGQHSRPAEDAGDALFGSQGADEQPSTDTRP